MTKYKLVNFCEFDKYASKAYCAIHGVDESLNLGDINKVDEDQLPDFNMICGGSPCTDFSVAGQGKGSIWTCSKCGYQYNPLTVHWSKRDKCPKCGYEEVEKTRSSLLVEYLRVIRAKKPSFGIYENVKNIVGKKFKETFDLFVQELEECGYNVYWKILNAKDYGIPQNRERVYLLFIQKDLDNGKFQFPNSIPLTKRLNDVLDQNVDEKYYLNSNKAEELVQNLIDRQGISGIISQTADSRQQTAVLANRKLIRGKTDIAPTLLARDYKGWAEREWATGVIEWEKIKIDSEVRMEEVNKIGNVYGFNGGNYAGNVYGVNGIAPTIRTYQGGNQQPMIIVAMRGRDPENPSDREKGIHTKQRLEPNYKGISNTITSVQKDNLVLECLSFRIRKLTPNECFRLMGFSNESFERAEVAVSNSQLYKQAGNSIVVDVLYYIFKELYSAMPYLFDDLRLSSFFSGIGAFESALDRLFDEMN